MLELKGCDPEILNDLDFLKSSLSETAIQIGATVIGDSFHRFSPQGVSGVVIISESHLFIHTWPEYGYAAVDVFTCGETVDPTLAVKPLVEKLGSKSSSVLELKRGILENAELAVK